MLPILVQLNGMDQGDRVGLPFPSDKITGNITVFFIDRKWLRNHADDPAFTMDQAGLVYDTEFFVWFAQQAFVKTAIIRK